MRLSLVIGIFLTLLLCWNAPVMALPLTEAQVQLVQTQENSNQENVTDSKELTKNQKLWNKQGVLDYSYTLTRSCFCTNEARGPVVIKVSNGSTSSVTSQSTGQPANPELFNRYDTIPKLFDVIRDAITRRADSINVQYNPTLGYPTQINIDYDRRIADEELFLTVENFTQAQTTKTKVFEVQNIEVSQELQSITAYGIVSTAGWRDAELILRPSAPNGEIDFVEFDFVAQPPNGSAAQVITPIKAIYSPLPRQGNFLGVKIYASNNVKAVVLE
ncbi:MULTISPECIES: DUF6174 domain-containing protein [Brasilonema]|uniref:DUF6174 domain-containing protein n=1 Tax=Brasilonema TaxID=383614 RepID=UPI00296ECE97|nr:DUF6174 domain-containing protein [Brasilonema sennae]